ncbi:hypothetical protein V8F33_003842 [Rhypophila sp. PSN 637]
MAALELFEWLPFCFVVVVVVWLFDTTYQSLATMENRLSNSDDLRHTYIAATINHNFKERPAALRAAEQYCEYVAEIRAFQIQKAVPSSK